MLRSIPIKDLDNNKLLNQSVKVNGWVKTFRSNRFIALNDGSTINDIQCVIDLDKNKNDINLITTGSSIEVFGKLVKSLGKGQKFEILVDKLSVLGPSSSEAYPCLLYTSPSPRDS